MISTSLVEYIRLKNEKRDKNNLDTNWSALVLKNNWDWIKAIGITKNMLH